MISGVSELFFLMWDVPGFHSADSAGHIFTPRLRLFW